MLKRLLISSLMLCSISLTQAIDVVYNGKSVVQIYNNTSKTLRFYGKFEFEEETDLTKGIGLMLTNHSGLASKDTMAIPYIKSLNVSTAESYHLTNDAKVEYSEVKLENLENSEYLTKVIFNETENGEICATIENQKNGQKIEVKSYAHILDDAPDWLIQALKGKEFIDLLKNFRWQEVAVPVLNQLTTK